MSAEDLEKYETEMELTLYKEYRDIVSQFSYVVETERRFYLANSVDVAARNADGEIYFEVRMSDAWVWDMYRPARFVKNVRVLTFKDVNVEELDKPDLRLPGGRPVRHLSPEPGAAPGTDGPADTGRPGPVVPNARACPQLRAVPARAARRRIVAAWQRRTCSGAAARTSRRDYLRAAGLVVLSRNWRCRDGELDVVATDAGPAGGLRGQDPVRRPVRRAGRGGHPAQGRPHPAGHPGLAGRPPGALGARSGSTCVAVRRRAGAPGHRARTTRRRSDGRSRGPGRWRCSGWRAVLVEIEADVGGGLPGVHLVGLPDAALHESRDRVRAAVVNSGPELAQRADRAGALAGHACARPAAGSTSPWPARARRGRGGRPAGAGRHRAARRAGARRAAAAGARRAALPARGAGRRDAPGGGARGGAAARRRWSRASRCSAPAA